MKAVITLSKTFLSNHPKAGEQTFFAEKLKAGFKIHTCRANYAYWNEKIARLKETNGVLSIRQWIGKPYNSPQIVIEDIPSTLIGIQKLSFYESHEYPELMVPFIDGHYVPIDQLARKDGLNKIDFINWFRAYDLSKPMAIIHFTNFRYQYHET